MSKSSHYLILHLEDDIALKETVGELLAAVEPDSEVHQFINSDDAMQYVQSNGTNIDIYLLDVRVPGAVDGVGLARRIRQQSLTGAIIFMSAYSKPDASQMVGITHYEWIKKPWSIDQLLEALERAKAGAAN
jgi:DNA-binding NtrC family response regulator